MSVAEKLQTVAENEQKVYDAGEEAGKASVTWQDRLKEFIDYRDAKYLFYEKTDMTTAPINYDDTANATDATSMFENCTSLTAIPRINCSNVICADSMFAGCTALTISGSSELNLDKVTDTSAMFANCTSITYAKIFGSDTVTDLSGMFGKCTSLIDIAVSDLPKAETLQSMFANCTSLTHMSILGTRNVKIFYGMFANCTKLEYIPALDLRSGVSFYNFVVNCKALTEIWVRNIRADLQVGSGTSWGHLITKECLLHLIKEVINTGSAIKLTVGTANIGKLGGTYVKLIDVTDEMRAEDEFIDDKYPFEVCESTDEGAMSINEYIATKNLTLV